MLGLKVSIMGALQRKVDGNMIVMPDYIKINEPKDQENIQNITPGVIFNRQREEVQA